MMAWERWSVSVVVWLAAALSTPAASYTNDTDWGGADWTLANGDVIAGAHTNVGAFAIPPGATVRVGAYTNGAGGRVTVHAASAAIGGVLSAYAAGYGGAAGPGAGTDRGGASHGGLGHPGYGGSIPARYGSVEQPTDLGSGGGNGTGAGGAGGGAIRLVAAGTIALAGTISAEGQTGVSGYSGGGSGGSIWLTADTLSGSGVVNAGGGHQRSAGGGGGGGRIAFDVTTDSFAGTVCATGGVSYFSQRAGHGTLNFQALYGPADDVTIRGSIALPPSTNWVFNSLTINPGATLDVQSETDTVSRITLAGDVLVNAGAGIAADGEGYRNGGGPGGARASATRAGGSYGGRGSSGDSGGQASNTYGSVSAPAELGSAGGNAGGSGGDTTVSGGSGGGAVILEAGGALTVNGTISANGWPGSSTYAGGGSGGSVWLTAATIAGTGTNEANGASRSAAVGGTLGGGGGGRIAFTTPDNQFAGTVRATGAWGRYHRAGHGTFNFQDVYGPADAVTITGNIALSPSNDWAFGSLTVAGGATLDIQSRTDLVSRVAVAGGVLVNEGAGIAADGLGFWYTQGPGAGSGRNGASHGGQGGNAPATGFSGPTYDAVNAPCELGSGGGNGSGAFHGGLGGGAVILTAGGTATISGTLSANGWHDAGSYSAGGSGGSVWIAAAAIEGAGLVQANGAPSGYGGGGGGRIAFTTPDNRFAGTVQAAGGSGGACDKAGNGTFNFGEFYGPSDDLVVAADIALPPSSNWSFASLTVVTSAALGGVVFEIQSATDLVSRVTVAGDVRVGSNAVLSASGLGFPWQQGPGAGVNRSGASHGGKGGDGVSGLGVAPPPYGASNAPSALGSGGGTGNSGTVGDPRGGGALILAIGGALTVDGVLAADGWRSGGGYGGGGSGGSIWALAKIVRGSGVLRADGGLGTVNGGGGGGGRVAVWNGGPFSAGVIACILAGETVPGMIVTNALPASFTGSLWARGGAGGNVGEDGTVVCISVPAPRGAIFGVR